MNPYALEREQMFWRRSEALDSQPKVAQLLEAIFNQTIYIEDWRQWEIWPKPTLFRLSGFPSPLYFAGLEIEENI